MSAELDNNNQPGVIYKVFASVMIYRISVYVKDYKYILIIRN